MEAMAQSDPGTIVVSEGIEDASTVSQVIRVGSLGIC